MDKHPGIYYSDSMSEEIKSNMRLHKITQEKLGNVLDCSRKTINRRLMNLDGVRFGKLKELCKELGIQAIIIK